MAIPYLFNSDAPPCFDSPRKGNILSTSMLSRLLKILLAFNELFFPLVPFSAYSQLPTTVYGGFIHV